MCRWIAALLITALSATTWAGIRGGNQLIIEGDSALELLEYCGEPAMRVPQFFGVTEWTYNFGPHQFMRQVLIEDGRIRRIERLDYGFEPRVGDRDRVSADRAETRAAAAARTAGPAPGAAPARPPVDRPREGR